ncbi:MAG: hypothetical protein M0024_01470 [Nitrospiraceae bacterium]|nr:hypothetical protein [Nitrospiraceae bacterium]
MQKQKSPSARQSDFRVVGVGMSVKCPATGELMRLSTCQVNMKVKKLWQCRGCQEAA